MSGATARRIIEVAPIVHDVPHQHLVMALDPVAAPAVVPAPAGFAVRTFRPEHAEADRLAWATVEVSAGEFPDGPPEQQLADAIARFDDEFMPHVAELLERTFFLEEVATGSVVGTTTAWYGELGGEVQGRIHWVAVSSSHMGRGLAKVLLSAALQCIHRHHARCFLTTQTTSARAVGLYLQLGFVPLVAEAALAELSAQEGDGHTRTVAQELAAWQSIEHLLPASALQALPSL
jgi:GNAT superfamily N-acetyltransferase